jgi:hypothetical protein
MQKKVSCIAFSGVTSISFMFFVFVAAQYRRVFIHEKYFFAVLVMKHSLNFRTS